LAHTSPPKAANARHIRTIALMIVSVRDIGIQNYEYRRIITEKWEPGLFYTRIAYTLLYSILPSIIELSKN